MAKGGSALKLPGAGAWSWGTPSVSVGQEQAEVGGYYFARTHGLIHRHHERVSVNPDQTARWQLSVDFELPPNSDAFCGKSGSERRFLFPLMYLRKSRLPTGMDIRDETGGLVTAPTRARSNLISSVAFTEAARRSLSTEQRWGVKFNKLLSLVLRIAAEKPYASNVVLKQLLDEANPAIRERWEEAGLVSDLEMLVEHSVLWVSLQGRPGEQRVMHVGFDEDLQRRAILQCKLGQLEPKRPWLPFNKARRARDDSAVLVTGSEGERFGLKGYRFSLSALGERLAQPLAWMPIELDFHTIYTKRCDSYHFELDCPSGLSPRELKVATDDEQEHELPNARKTRATRAAHFYLPDARSIGPVTIRATVGVGGGAFPVLWFLAGTITSIVLWSLVASEPTLLVGNVKNQGKNEILAGLLLLVPALLGALVYGAEEGPVARFIGGARILLLVTGLCAMGATSVLIGAKPFELSAVSIWTACATVATAATVPLATSWLLSSPLVWLQLRKLDTPHKQWKVLWGLIAAAAMVVILLILIGDVSMPRVACAILLLALIVPMILVANDRAAVPMKADRRYLSLSAAIASLTCLTLGCIELRAAFDPSANLNVLAELIALVLFFVALFAGRVIRWVGMCFAPNAGEVHVSPRTREEFIAGERIRELRQLRESAGKANCGRLARLKVWFGINGC